MQNAPIPANEMDRLISLSEFDIDYTNHQESFKDLAKLASKIAGTDVSLINLIDGFTQWTIASHGFVINQMPREDSVCQYTIMENDYLEIKNLTMDDRFKDNFYVTNPLNFRYYYGVPLKCPDGYNLGTLCVLDNETQTITPEKAGLLKIIADEIVNRLNSLKVIDSLKNKLNVANEDMGKLAHDIRGSLCDIISLAQIINEQGHENQIEEVLEFTNMIYKSGHTVLKLADEILTANELIQPANDAFNLALFKDGLEKLYQPQAKNKRIAFSINVSPELSIKTFPKNKLLQITGNIISNAIKFMPAKGKVLVQLDLIIKDGQNMLVIKVIDTWIVLTPYNIDKILNGNVLSTYGTVGEQGYGVGLALVKQLTESLKATFTISSERRNGTTFTISLPL